MSIERFPSIPVRTFDPDRSVMYGGPETCCPVLHAPAFVNSGKTKTKKVKKTKKRQGK